MDFWKGNCACVCSFSGYLLNSPSLKVKLREFVKINQ